MTRTRAFACLPLTLGLAAILMLAACAPSASFAPMPTATRAGDTPALPADTQTLETATQPTVQTEAAAPAAVATSRGPALEASDPTTVQLASGGLQLVEFFRFT